MLLAVRAWVFVPYIDTNILAIALINSGAFSKKVHIRPFALEGDRDTEAVRSYTLSLVEAVGLPKYSQLGAALDDGAALRRVVDEEVHQMDEIVWMPCTLKSKQKCFCHRNARRFGMSIDVVLSTWISSAPRSPHHLNLLCTPPRCF